MHTGGFTFGWISTKSRLKSSANLRASLIGITPNCSPSAPIQRTLSALINSLILGPSWLGGVLFSPTIRKSPLVLILRYYYSILQKFVNKFQKK